MGRRHTREQWLDWFSEHRVSGLSVAEFCVGKDITPQSFYRWRKKLAEQDQSEATFVPVSLTSRPSIEIDLPCGVTVRVAAERSLLDCVLRSLIEIGADA